MVKIKRNTNGDSRVADHIPSIEEFDCANSWHRQDVFGLMRLFGEALDRAAREHDWTKTAEPYRSMFYRDLCATLEGHLPNFMEGEWAKQHYYENERHHLATYASDDVNMFDVVEMICDCVAAGMARSGEIYDVEIPDEVLQKAVKNTVKWLKNRVEVVG